MAAAGRTGPLRGSIAAELGVAACVLAVTAVLGLTPPARTLASPLAMPEAAGTAPGRAVWTQADGIGALVEIDPARVGFNTVTLSIDRPRPPLEVWLELRQERAGVTAVRRPMRRDAGRWVYAGPELAVPGRWTIRAEALLNDYEQTTFTTEIDIP